MFKNRIDAAHQLAEKLSPYKGKKNTLILAIPRGGLEIGAVLREELHLPLDIIITKKIGAPHNEEYAIGAVDPEGKAMVNQNILQEYGLKPERLSAQIQHLRHLIKTRYEEYREGEAQPPSVLGKIVLLVDDGIATGFTTLAALSYLRRQRAQKIILAVPVLPRSVYSKLLEAVDELICLEVSDHFFSVSQFYQNFPQVTDQKAKMLLDSNVTHHSQL